MNHTIRKAVKVGLTFFLLVAAGCQLPIAPTTETLSPEFPPAAAMTISYTTASDRLNVAMGGGSTVQFAGHQPATTRSLPNLTRSTLQIRLPHPSGRPDLAQATLTARLENDSSTGTANLLTQFWREESETPLASETTVGVWELDVPAWQARAIRQRLQQENFFRRSRVLDAEVELSVVDDAGEFAKPFRTVPELDALLLRVVREGRPMHVVNAADAGISFERTPALW